MPAMCKAEVAQRGRRVTPELVPYSLLEKMTKLENNLALTITIIIFGKRIHYYLHQYRVWIEEVKLSPGLVEMKVKVLVAQSCLTLCNPMDCSPPGSSVHRIFHARMLEWVAMPSPGDRPNPGIKPRSPALQADSLPAEIPGKPSEEVFSSPTVRLSSW